MGFKCKKNLPKKIYIDRADSRYKTRNIVNDNEVKNFLEKKGFKTLKLTDYSFVDQVELFNSAENVAGLHGAGFANIIFCKPNTKILELRTKYTGKVIENLAIKSSLNFNKIEIEPENIDASDQQGHVHVDIKELENKVS